MENEAAAMPWDSAMNLAMNGLPLIAVMMFISGIIMFRNKRIPLLGFIAVGVIFPIFTMAFYFKGDEAIEKFVNFLPLVISDNFIYIIFGMYALGFVLIKIFSKKSTDTAK